MSTLTSTTPQRIIDAAFAQLRDAGHRGATARGIAAAGGFNQALIFYHFGSVEHLLIAALDQSAEARLAAYRDRFEGVTSLPELANVARDLYREDVGSGHVKVLAELVAAGASSPELGRAVAARVAPWLAFTRETIERLLAGSPLAALLSPDDAAFALTSLYLGMELLTNLDGDASRADALFEALIRLASLLSAFMPAAQEGA